MANQTEQKMLGPTGLDRGFVQMLIDEHQSQVVGSLQRLWDYYRNEYKADDSRDGLAQASGLPSRLTGGDIRRDLPEPGSTKREVVIENDIGWRIHTMVDFMFGKPIVIQSCAGDDERAELIEQFLAEVFRVNGGIGFFQDLALLGSVYGYVDVLLRVDRLISRVQRMRGNKTKRQTLARDQLIELASDFVLETVEGQRAIPILNETDYRKLDGYMLNYRQPVNQVAQQGFLQQAGRSVLGTGLGVRQQASIERTQIWTDQVVADYAGSVDEMLLVDEWVNSLGRIPVVHIQNMAQPYFYEGLGDVEPLVVLQDELNTRLSDRANRVTFQSFKMYLGKGIEHFTDRPVGPGQMWSTDNPDASIQEFGGDGASPSEEAHIAEIREAMDKASGVTPVAAGLLKGRVGNLTSESALRVTLMGVLSKTEKKRVTYGEGIERLCELILHAADVTGVLPNRPEERRVRINWPSVLPVNEEQRLREAKMKVELGVPRKQVLMELGYGECGE